MAGGDIWMMVMVGAVLGWQALAFVFLASSVQGILAAIAAVALGKKQQTKDQNGLFRNEVVHEVEAEIHGETPEDQQASSEPESLGKLAVPYGPFIALAAVEYVFFGKYLLPLLSGNTLTPWGFAPWH